MRSNSSCGAYGGDDGSGPHDNGNAKEGSSAVHPFEGIQSQGQTLTHTRTVHTHCASVAAAAVELAAAAASEVGS